LRFKRNRLGYWSLLLFSLLVVASLCAELLSNDRPLVVKYEGQYYFPVVQSYYSRKPSAATSTPRPTT
jgi:microcin C transport system permease protein